MKKKSYLLLLASTMVLASCSWQDLMFWKKWFNKNEPGQQQNKEEHHEQEEKSVVSIISVNAPQQIEQGQNLTTVQLTVGYSDGSTGTVSSTSVSLVTSQTGTITGTAYYNDLSKTFTIEVYSNNIATHHGTFTTASGSVTPGDGFTDITLVNAESDSIEVRAEKVSVNETQLTAQKNSYFVMYNKVTSPLNDISDLACAWSHVPTLASSESIVYALYFSYNFLSLDDIFAGYYQDLVTFTGTFGVYGSNDSFSTASASIAAPNARYFLALVQTPTSDLSLTGMQVVSSHSEAPAPVEKGTYAYPAGTAENFGGITNGFPFFGNGSISFKVDDHGTELTTFQRQGKYEWFVSQLTSDGYVHATEMMGIVVYQKPYDDSKSYTYALQLTEFSGFELIQLSYAGLYATMIEETSWPGDELKAGLTNESFKALVIDPEFTGSVSYVTIVTQDTGEHAAGVMVNQKDSDLRAQFVANGNILKSYMANYVNNYGYTFKSQWGGDFTEDSFSYSASVISSDYKNEIDGVIMYDPTGQFNMLQLSYTEYLFGAFPTSAVREYFSDNSFPVLASANGQFSYKTNNEIRMTAIGVTKAELDAYWDSLENYDMNVYDYNSGEYHYYSANKLFVDSTGAFTYRVSAYLYADRIELTYEKSEAGYDSKFNEAMSKISYNLSGDIAAAVGDEFNYGHFVYDSNNKVIYAIGYGQAEAQQLLNACENDPVLGCYVFYDEEETYKGALKISVDVMDNYLIIHASTINSSIWSNYKNENNTTDVNKLIDDLFEYAGAENSSDYYLGTNQLVFNRGTYSFEIYAYGATVVDVINAYKTTLLANTNIKYSAYMNKYVNTATGVAVSFNMYDTETIPYAVIRFSFFEDFIDYVKYSEIASDLATFEHLNLYPSLDVLGENEAGFVFFNSSSDYASVYLSEAAYNAYLAVIEADNNFALIYSNMYQYVDADGNLAQVEFFEYNHFVNLSYTEHYFTTIDSIKSDFDSNSYTFYENYVLPSQSGNVFRCYSYYDNYMDLQFAKNQFDESAYIAELLAGGFKESHRNSTDIVYTKIVGHVSYVVEISDNYIYYRTTTYDNPLLSYEGLVTELLSREFESAKLDNFVTITGMENNYYLWNGYSNEFTVLISSGETTVDAYIAALLSAGYQASEDPGYYQKGETSVYVTDYDGFLFIQYHDERIIYKSFSEVLAKATSQGFDSRVLDYVLAPTQTGNLYSFAYCSTSRLEFYYDADLFDLDAYKEALVDAGYIKNGSFYEKGQAEVYISTGSSRIELYYSGSLD